MFHWKHSDFNTVSGGEPDRYSRLPPAPPEDVPETALTDPDASEPEASPFRHCTGFPYPLPPTDQGPSVLRCVVKLSPKVASRPTLSQLPHTSMLVM